MNNLRQTIVLEIKRLAATNGGRPLGRRAFEQQTGIREADWCGVFWARWSDALLEAGFSANKMQGRADRTELLEKLALSCVHYQKMPTVAEYELLRAQDASFPSYKTFQSNFGAKENIVWELRQWLTQVQDPQVLLELLPTGRPKSIPLNVRNRPAPTFGYVYLLHSGQHYKIGRSDELRSGCGRLASLFLKRSNSYTRLRPTTRLELKHIGIAVSLIAEPTANGSNYHRQTCWRSNAGNLNNETRPSQPCRGGDPFDPTPSLRAERSNPAALLDCRAPMALAMTIREAQTGLLRRFAPRHDEG